MTKSARALARCLLAMLALSVGAPAYAAMQAKPIEWKVGAQSFSGYLVYDDASQARRPGLVMVPDWLGVTPEAVEKAKQIAGDDYVVLVADMYGKGIRPKGPEEALAQVKKMYADVPAMRARANQAVATLKAQAGKAPLDASKIGAFGFCFGGSSVLELARSGAQLAGVVSFHGGLQSYAPPSGEKIVAPVLVLNGAEDRSVTREQIAAFEDEMDKAGADWQFVNFSGAVHCFALENANRPPGCVYDERAAKRAYRIMEGFWRERFAGR